MKKIKNEILDIFLHITVLNSESMRGIYKQILLFLLKYKFFRSTRKKYGKVIANRIINNPIFKADIKGSKFKMEDGEFYEYYINHLRGNIYEQPLILKLKNLFENNPYTTFIDMGAHYGYFSLIAAMWLKPTGKVISIEPNHTFYQKLNKNILLNNHQNFVKTFNVGLSEKTGLAKMGRWNNRRTLEKADGDIQIVTFDSLCEKEKISPDIIKIDVHGAEGNILAGMPKMLRNNVSHLFCELHEDMNGYSSEDIVKMLENSGLYVYEFTQHRSKLGGKIIPISDEFHSDYIDRVIYATRYEI